MESYYATVYGTTSEIIIKDNTAEINPIAGSKTKEQLKRSRYTNLADTLMI